MSRRGELANVRLPQDALVGLTRDLNAGRVVVAPKRPVEESTGTFTGWWRIDPGTGNTLGVGPNGWGQSMSERGVQMHPLIELAKTFAFEYGFCQAVPQVLN